MTTDAATPVVPALAEDSQEVEAFLILQNGSVYNGTVFGSQQEVDGEVGMYVLKSKPI